MRFSILVAFLGMTTSALADDSAALQTQLFGHAMAAKETGYACFSRVYDAAHLSAHPKQNVTEALLLLKGAPGDDAKAGLHYSPALDFKFRKSTKHFQASGDCSSISSDAKAGVKLGCGIDCDGGTINVTLKDTDTVVVALPTGIAVTQAGNPDNAPDGSRFGKDDVDFKLTRTALKNCLPLAFEDEDKAALKKAP